MRINKPPGPSPCGLFALCSALRHRRNMRVWSPARHRRVTPSRFLSIRMNFRSPPRWKASCTWRLLEFMRIRRFLPCCRCVLRPWRRAQLFIRINRLANWPVSMDMRLRKPALGCRPCTWKLFIRINSFPRRWRNGQPRDEGYDGSTHVFIRINTPPNPAPSGVRCVWALQPGDRP